MKRVMADLMFATHNCLSYSGLKNWWLYPFYFMGKCQKVSIEEQYEKYGVRFFDIRINHNTDETLESAHGFLIFKKGVNEALDYLDKKGDCYVRIVLEQGHKKKNQDEIDRVFVEKCKYIEKTYKSIKFTCGQRKYDGKQLYDFKNTEPITAELYSSVTSLFGCSCHLLAIIDDWFPWLYARIMNKDNIEETKANNEYQYIMLDFINIQ